MSFASCMRVCASLRRKARTRRRCRARPSSRERSRAIDEVPARPAAASRRRAASAGSRSKSCPAMSTVTGSSEAAPEATLCKAADPRTNWRVACGSAGHAFREGIGRPPNDLRLAVGYHALRSVDGSGCSARGCVRCASPTRACGPRISLAADNGAGGGSHADHRDCSNDPLHESPFVANDARPSSRSALAEPDARRDFGQLGRPSR